MSAGSRAAVLALYLAATPSAVRAFAPDPGLEKDLGWFDANTQSDFFLRVSTARPRGAIRIGVFGESNAAGVGVGDGEAFPALLEAEFRSRGIRNVSVVSFAVGGYGAHQAHMLWRHAAEDYGLDIIVFCFWPFLPERDTAFLTPWSQERAGSRELHARYVLEGGGLRRVALAGASQSDAVRRYWSWIPSWTDARYSRQTPLPIRRLLPRGRRLVANPFYYDRRRSMEEEALESYRLVLQDLSRSGKAVVAWYDPQGWGEAFRRIALAGQASNVVALGSLAVSGVKESGFRSLFHAPDGHISAVTHRNIARELFAALTGQASADFDAYRWDAPSGNPLRPGAARSAPLRDCRPVKMKVGGRDLLYFHPMSSKKENGFDLRAANAASLLLVGTKQPLFYVLDSLLSPESSLGIALSMGGGEVSIQLGPIHSQSPILGRVGIPEGTREALSPGGERLTLEPSPGPASQPCWRLRPEQSVDRAALLVDGRILVDDLEPRDVNGARSLCASRARAGTLRLAPGAYASLHDVTRAPTPLELSLGEKGRGRRLPLGVLTRDPRRRPLPRSSRPILEIRPGPSGGKEAALSVGIK